MLSPRLIAMSAPPTPAINREGRPTRQRPVASRSSVHAASARRHAVAGRRGAVARRRAVHTHRRVVRRGGQHRRARVAVGSSLGGGARRLLLLALVGARARVKLGEARVHLAHVLDDERHHEVREAVAPGELERDIGLDEVVARVERGAEALLLVVVHEVAQQRLGELGVARVSARVDGVLVDLVRLGEVDGGLPALVLLVQEGGDAAELEQLVLLDLLRQRDLVEVVELLDGAAQLREVLIVDVQLVQRLVDGAQVLRLHALQVLDDERQLVVAVVPHLVHHARVVQLGRQHAEQAAQLGRLLLQVEVDGAVVELRVADLLDDLDELVGREGLARVLDHDAHRVVVLLRLRVQEGGLLPLQVGLARAQHLAHVDAAPEVLEVLHELVGAVLGVQHRQLREDALVRALQTQPLLQQLDHLLEVAEALVQRDQLLQVVRVHDDVQAADLREAELARLDARRVHHLPRARRRRLAGRVHGVAEGSQPHVARRQLGVGVDAVEQHARRLELALGEQAVAHRLDLRDVAARDEDLEVAQALRLRQRVHQLRVHEALLELLARHLQEAHQVVVLAGGLRGGRHVLVRGRVVGLDEGVDGGLHLARRELRARQPAPHLRVVDTVGELERAGQVADVVDEHARSLDVVVELLVDGEGLLEELVLLAHGDLGDLGPVEVVEALDVLHSAALLRVLAVAALDGRQDQQVLQVLVLGEVAALQHQLLEQRQQLVRQVRLHERLDRVRHHLGVLRLRQRRAAHLVDHAAAVRVVRRQHTRPQLLVLALHEVARLILEQPVGVRHLDQLLVAAARAAAVRDEGEERVELLAELADDGRVVVRVVREELLRVLVLHDVDLADGVVRVRVRRALRDALLQELLQQAQARARLDLLDERADGALRAHAGDERLDEVLVAVEVEQAADDLRRLGRRHLLHVHLDELLEAVGEEVRGELVHVAVAVAHVDERARVGQLGVEQERLDLLGVVHLRVAAHALHLLELVQLGRCHDVLVVHRGRLGRVHDGAQVVVEPIKGVVLLEQRDEALRHQVLRVLGGHLDDHLQVGADVHRQQLVQALQAVLRRHRAEESLEELRRDGVRVDDDALDVVDVGEQLERAVEQRRLLAQLRHVVAVEVVEHVARQDGVGHLRRAALQVHLEQARLQRALLLAVARQHVEQEARRLLQAVELHEDLDHLVHLDQRTALVAVQLRRQLLRRLGVGVHEVLQHEGVVGHVAVLVGVRHDLVDLARRHVAVDHLLVRLAAAQVHLQRERGVVGRHQVAQHLAALHLVLAQPLLHQLRLALLQRRPRQLHALNLVQLALLHQRREVLEHRRLLARRRRQALEARDGLRVAQRVAGRLGRDLGGALVVARRE
mmetsp:Transcript_20370/g.72036  ORF Transcript_20370/g.72036 Transcript_20370/m.72036 type:complete len:1359 (-) Transcript_20370:1324-5400(-)